MVRYIIVNPMHTVDLETSTTPIVVLCKDAVNSVFYWTDARTNAKIVMFKTREEADNFISANGLEGAFSYALGK
nr:MAG TPA: REGULATORY PROTEIN E2 beta barrel, activator, DNA-binding [Caudoviricetes sp.]